MAAPSSALSALIVVKNKKLNKKRTKEASPRVISFFAVCVC